MVENNMPINIFFASDKKYFPYLETAIASLLINANDDDKLNIFILSSDLYDSYIDKLNELKRFKDCKFELINVDNSRFTDLKSPDYISSSATFFRYLIPEIRKDIDKVLYLDSDIIVLGSIKELYSIDLEDNYIAGVEDPHVMISSVKVKKRFHIDDRYINAGVLLFNCKKMREDNFTEKCFNLSRELSSRAYFGADQDVINILSYNKKKIIDIKYNLLSSVYMEQLHTEYTDAELNNAIKNPIIIHYSDRIKPWNYYGFTITDRNCLYYKYAKFTTSYDKKFILKASFFNEEFARKVRRIKNNLFLKMLNSIFQLVLDILGFILSIILFPKYFYKLKGKIK